MLDYMIMNQNSKNVIKRLLTGIFLKISCLYSRILEKSAERHVSEELVFELDAEAMIRKINDNKTGC